MKDWSEIKEGMSIYMADPQPIFKEENYSETPDEYTEPFTRAKVGYVDRDEVQVVIQSAKYNYAEMFFHQSEDDVTRFLTPAEYKLMNSTEAMVWPKLLKLIPEIQGLKEKSEDMVTIEQLILKHGGTPK